MATEKAGKKNGKLSLYPLKFEEAVMDLLRVNPQPKKFNGKSGDLLQR